MSEEISDLDRPRTVKQLAAELQARGDGVSIYQLYRWIASGSLPHVRLGRGSIRTTLRSFYAACSPVIPEAAEGQR
jgi:hypothetical protein